MMDDWKVNRPVEEIEEINRALLSIGYEVFGFKMKKGRSVGYSLTVHISPSLKRDPAKERAKS
jgi:hypothetical protein